MFTMCPVSFVKECLIMCTCRLRHNGSCHFILSDLIGCSSCHVNWRVLIPWRPLHCFFFSTLMVEHDCLITSRCVTRFYSTYNIPEPVPYSKCRSWRRPEGEGRKEGKEKSIWSQSVQCFFPTPKLVVNISSDSVHFSIFTNFESAVSINRDRTKFSLFIGLH